MPEIDFDGDKDGQHMQSCNMLEPNLFAHQTASFLGGDIP